MVRQQWLELRDAGRALVGENRGAVGYVDSRATRSCRRPTRSHSWRSDAIRYKCVPRGLLFAWVARLGKQM